MCMVCINVLGDSSDHDQERVTPHARKPHPPDNKGGSHNTDNVPIKIYAEGDHNVAKAFKQLRKGVEDEWIVHDLTESVLFRMPQQKVSITTQDLLFFMLSLDEHGIYPH